MANYIGSARTNYFRVKDVAKFEAWASLYDGVEVIHGDDDEGLAGLMVTGDGGGWPNQRATPENEDDLVEVDIVTELAEHLQEGSVAIVMEVGAEKLRYLIGWAVAINSKKATVGVNIYDVYEKAKQLGTEITEVNG